MNDWDQDPELAKVPPGMPNAPAQDARKAKRTVYRFLCELRNPSPEPFAVMEIESDGLPATVVSLHMMREDAEKAIFGFNEGLLS